MKRIIQIIDKTEVYLLLLLLISMLLVAVSQILLRNLFGFGMIWSESLVRVLVLWTAMIGAMIATRKSKHIAMDAVIRFIPVRAKTIVDRIVNASTAIICAVVAYYCLSFVQMDYEFGTRAFGSIPAWLCESILPWAFAVMSIRYAVYALNPIQTQSTENND